MHQLVSELESSGYQRVEQRSSAGFGDELIAFAREALSVRLVRDRGQWFVEASPVGGEDWFDADVWHSALTETVPPSEPRSSEEQARLMRDDLPAISARVVASAAPAVEQLRMIRAARSRRRLGLETEDGGG